MTTREDLLGRTANLAWIRIVEKKSVMLIFPATHSGLPAKPHPGGLRVVVCLYRAGIRALIVHIHILDLNAVLGLGVTQEDHTRI